MRYKKATTVGVVYFKVSVDQNTSFKLTDVRRKKLGKIRLPNLTKTYNGPLPMTQKKKQALLSLFTLLDPVYHSFYQSLSTDRRAKDKLPTVVVQMKKMLKFICAKTCCVKRFIIL